MVLKNARIFINGAFKDCRVNFGTRILDVGAVTEPDDALDGEGCYLIPGLVDIHTHAAVGEDASDGNADGMMKMSRYYAAGGVTSWCPTTMTLKEPELTLAMHTIRGFVHPADGAKVAGINLEGPFLSLKKCGAQNPDNLHVPDAAMFHRLNEASGGLVRLVTVAPEEPGAIEFIREISNICTVSVGHTTSDYATALAAYEAGAKHTTHLFNAMTPLAHRAPGVIGAAFDADATVELITDGLHIDPSVVRITHKLFGKRLTLISDSLRCAGMPDGEYELGGQPITVHDGKATLTGTNTLAGSSIHLMDGLRRAVSFGIPLEEAVTASTLIPAKVIGMANEIGSIDPGKYADFVLLNRDLSVRAVFIEGRQIAGKALKL